MNERQAGLMLVGMSKQGVRLFTILSCIVIRLRPSYGARLVVAATAGVTSLAGVVQTAAGGSPVGMYSPPNGASAVAAAQAAAAAAAAGTAAPLAQQVP